MALEPCRIINLRTGAVVAHQAKIARDFQSRSVGLLNRTSLGKDEALLIYPCNSIHTFFMKFPIDVAFLDKNHKIVRIVHNLKPWKLQSCHVIAKSTLEMASETMAEKDMQIGDLLKFD